MNYQPINILKRVKSNILSHRANYKGEKTNSKFLIIESDDWGSIRTPSSETLYKFENQGIDLSQSVYKYDALASNTDLDELFNLLVDFKDSHGTCAKITANTIVANPDFIKIRESDFKEYHYETFTNTLAKYPAHDKAFSIWLEAMDKGIFIPQFHGREHLNINRWLKRLQSGDELTRYCFDNESTYSGEDDYSFMEAYDWDDKNDIINQREIINDGLNLFQNLFGYSSASFIAPCYNWDPAIEATLAKSGVKILQGKRNQLIPTGTFEQYVPKRHFYGETNSYGTRYNIRNCFFEPSLKPSKDWVDSCLAQIRNAFSWNKPAVICSHRINYIGYIKPANRDRGLKDLKKLLTKVLQRWPEVEFISTNELLAKQEWQ